MIDHDEAVRHVREVFDDVHMDGTEGARMGRYVADMADAAKRLEKALIDLCACFPHGEGLRHFHAAKELMNARAVLASLSKNKP